MVHLEHGRVKDACILEQNRGDLRQEFWMGCGAGGTNRGRKWSHRRDLSWRAYTKLRAWEMGERRRAVADLWEYGSRAGLIVVRRW